MGETERAMLAKLRFMAKDSLSKQLHHNAIMFVELIFGMPGCDMSDIVLSAQCYFQNGEIRRSLAVLESKGLLSVDNIQLVAEMMTNDESTGNHQHEENHLLCAIQLGFS